MASKDWSVVFPLMIGQEFPRVGEVQVSWYNDFNQDSNLSQGRHNCFYTKPKTGILRVVQAVPLQASC